MVPKNYNYNKNNFYYELISKLISNISYQDFDYQNNWFLN